MSFIKKEPVLSAAAVLAFLSMFFVAPSPEYLSYIDFRTLALLFSLMTVVAGLKEIGLFRYLGSSLLAGMHSTRQLAFTLTALCFFSSMLITNDVSLITFVPFSILILNMAGLPESQRRPGRRSRLPWMQSGSQDLRHSHQKAEDAPHR